MSRRVSKITAAALFTVVLSMSTPVYAAYSRGGGDPDFGTRIVRILKTFAHRIGLLPSAQDTTLSVPKP